MVNSTGGGPQLEWVGDGYYYDNFVFGRKIVQKESTSPAGTVDRTAGEQAVGP